MARSCEAIRRISHHRVTKQVKPRHPPRPHDDAIESQRAPVAIRVGSPDDSYARVFWTAFRRSANAMFLVDLDRRIVAVNEAATVLAGRSAGELVGERIITLLEEPAEAPGDTVWRAQVLRGESFGRRRISRPDGG